MPVNKKISVILPTLNERLNIVALINRIHSELRDYNHEILVVDDDSPDGTYQVVLDLNYVYVKTILRTKNHGLANSIRCGLENAKGQIFIVMDSDFNHKPEYLSFMVQSLLHYDCVFASRFLYGGGMNNLLHQILSWVFNVFIRFMVGGKILDSLYGFFAIKRETIEQLNYDNIFWGYGDFCMRLLYYLQKNRADILQMPAVNGKRRGGKGNRRFLGVFFQYFVAALKLIYKARIKDKCIKK